MDSVLSDLIAHSTSGPLVVVGHSMGGQLAAQLALNHPDRVIAAVLIAPGGLESALCLETRQALLSPRGGSRVQQATSCRFMIRVAR